MEQNKSKNTLKKIFIIIMVIVIIVGTNLITFFASSYFLPYLNKESIVVDADDKVAIKNINKLLFLSEELESSYLWDYNEQDLWDGAIKGFMDGTGDPYTSYMDQEDYENYELSAQTSFGGIGVQITNDENNNVIINKVFMNYPAHKVGITIGDIIVSADEVDLRDMNINKAVTYLRGEKGSKVKIGVLRGNEYLEFEVERTEVEVINVEHKMLDNNIGYIHILQFEDNSYEQFSKALDAMSKKGMNGLILDLRENPGGNVAQSVMIVDELLGKCEVIYTLDANGEKEYYHSDADKIDIPIVVLADEYSASASEIVVAALVDNDAAEFVGVNTYGKGIMQIYKPMSDGSLYHYTIMEYFAPSGMKIHGVGIAPDYEVEPLEKYKNKLIEEIPFDDDVQLQKAIEVLTDSF